jgi:6-phosphogluconolactonase
VSVQLLSGKLGPNQARQDKPHPHSVTFSPDGHFAYVCDLGLDKIFCYRLDASALVPAGEFATAPGAGPRHSKFSADGKFFYVLNELDGTIATYACDPATGALTAKQAVPTLPEGFTGNNTCAEIRLHPNGRFVYGSNRGHDSIAVFARNPADGTLKRIEIVPSGGGHPRNFALSLDGAWLVCANRDSNNLVVFKVDPVTGRLTATGHTAKVPQAVCVLFCN